MSSAEEKPIVTEGASTNNGPSTEVAVPAASGYDNVTPEEVAETTVKRARLTYAGLMFIGFVLGIIAKYEAFEWIAKWAIDKGCDGSDSCIGAQSCYRIAFSLWLFFFIHWALSSPWNLCLDAAARVRMNQVGIFWKFISLIPLFILSFVIPNDFFVFFAWCSMIASAIFLIVQLIVLLDFSYTWSEDWATREDSKFQTGLLVCTVVMNIGAIVFVALSYVYFGKPGCQLPLGATSVTLIGGILYTGLSIVAPHGSILPSATVFLYTAYSCFSALLMFPGECNSLHSSGNLSLIVSTIFSAISIAYMTVSAGTSRGAFQLSDEEEADTVEEAEAKSFSFFHVIMMLGSCYLAMLLTNWTIVGSDNMAQVHPEDNSVAPLWAKLASEWVCILLYTWTLVAPMICKDREFA